MSFRNLFIATAAVGLLSTTACKNPADDVPAATVTPGAAVTEGSAAAEAPAEEGSAAPAGEEGLQPGIVAAPGFNPANIGLMPENTTIGFVGSKVTASHEGGFHRFGGTVIVPPSGDLRGASLSVNIEMDSIFTDNDRLTGHLQSDDFFNVAQFPQAEFNSTAIAPGEGNTATITGNLTMHGVTNQVSFPATITLTDSRLVANAEFSINRQDWGIVYTGMPDDLIRDEVVLSIDIDTDR